jgi:predicted aldo/keto reductase-like oxidoreductase
MECRRLGRTGPQVSVIGLGTEYLNHQSRKTVTSVVREAVERGVNYLDMVFAFAEYRDNLAAALQGIRDKVVIAGHICTAETNGHYRMSRDVAENEALFHDLLARLHTDHVDLVFVQMVNSEEGYAEVTRPGGVLELAHQLRRQGKARWVGMSGHRPAAALKAIRGGLVDVWMYPINLAWDLTPGRQEVQRACAETGVGLVAMKPFGGGRLFLQEQPRPTPPGTRGGVAVTPTQALHYVLSQPGVCTAVPGLKNPKQLQAALHYAEASEDEKDYAPILADFQQDLQGNCVYCNHCMPCSVGIDIGRTLEGLDRVLAKEARERERLRERLGRHCPPRIRAIQLPGKSAPASDCTECGDCVERCPFGVDVIARMQQAAELCAR